MIGRIAGRLEYRATDHVLIDVRGVGYLVYVSDRTLASLPGPGEAVALYTELLVREDILQLFGFPTLVEKEWHRLLMTVQGVGARASMAILGALGAEGVSRSIALGDARSIQAAPGVGPKIAQRVVLELKSKAPSVMAMGRVDLDDPVLEEEPAPGPALKRRAAPKPSNVANTADALSALANLGYAPADAASAVMQTAAETPDADTTTLIRLSLRRLAPKE
ncbi:Holliday junction branch migration protein RuvA [Falsirhodobacter sp. 20TX0035]|uniref:Holliday junction branch migration protein RuvA n=1 Tax=Falsirhodobacter sp. 20TX0035 TaxID=3022019 RepID=UPI00232D82ED|nr:Holliday junction branch migration protein RuvA [Falsirhodobacter sp. 20TX0035]MDB6453891.1 Holliday junction branch migration protein RuvA [Falsirhodobacter sp. 20TX0035]